MEELKRKENLPVQAKTEGNILMVEFGNAVTQRDLQVFASQMQEMLEKMQANQNMNTEKTQEKITVVENKVDDLKQDEITKRQLDNMTDLVRKKATAYVTKNHIQLSIEMYETDEFALAYKQLVKKMIAKTCRTIWKDLKVNVLKVKPSKFTKYEIKLVDVDRCIEYIRNEWGGFSV